MLTKVNLNGINLWMDRDDLDRIGDTPLAPANHVVNGELDWDVCSLSDTYGHVCKDAGVSRYGRKIADVSDIKDGWVDDE